MDKLLFSLNIILPLIIMMAIGFIARLTGVLSYDSAKHINKLIYYVLLPFMVFNNIYNTDIKAHLQSSVITFSVIILVIIFFIALSIVLLSEKDNTKRGVMLQGMFHSNYLLYGIPFVTLLYGQAAGSRATFVIGVIILPLLNLLSVMALEMFNGGRPGFFKTFIGIFRSPIIIASIIAVLLSVFGVRLPSVLTGTIQTVSSITVPLAFIALGALFSFSDVGVYIRQILITSSVKLIVFPLIFLFIAVFFGYRNVDLAIIMAVLASPVAVESVAMSQEMGGNERLAGQLVFFTSILSFFTIFLFIFLFSSLGYLV